MKKIILSVALLSISSFSYAEDINAIFKKVNDLVTQQNYSKALDELKWASKEIEKMHAEKLKTFLPDSLAGFNGDKVQSSNALGITNLERTYRKANGSVKISFTNLGGGSAAGSGMEGFAQLGKMAAMFGGGNGVETFRVQGRTATLENQDNGGDLTVFLDSGSILKLEAQSGAKAEDLKALAEGLKLDDIDSYLKGK